MKRILVLSLALALTALTATFSRAQQSATGGEPPSGPPPAASPNVTPPPPPFTKLNIFMAGPVVFGSSGCPDVTCYGGNCSCEAFSGLKVQGGLAGTKLSGEIVFEGNYLIGNCYQAHGIATAAAKNFSINFGIQGMDCYDPSLSFDHLQVIGNYVILGGSGPYGHAAGTGSFSNDMPNFYQTTTRSMVFSGVIQKAK